MGYAWELSGEGGKSILEDIQLNISWVVFYTCDTFVFSLLALSKIFLNKLLFVLSLRPFETVGDKDSQGDINKLCRLQIWAKKKRVYSDTPVRGPWSGSVGNTRPEVGLDHSTKDNTGADQNRMPLLQGTDRRVTPHCSEGNLKPRPEGLCTRKGILNIGVSRGGTGKSMKRR